MTDCYNTTHTTTQCLSSGLPMKLHLGCGGKYLEGYFNIDARPEVESDLTADVTKLTSFNDNMADVIYACHIFEHVPKPQVSEVLTEWKRILRPGGILRIAVPDFEAVAKLYNDGVPMQRLIGLLCGRQNHQWNVHYMVYDWHLLCAYLSEVGFFGMKRWNPKDTYPSGYDDYSYAEIDGIAVSLNVEATA